MVTTEVYLSIDEVRNKDDIESIKSAMSYHPRIETDKYSNLLTSRCRNSQLWFANNAPVEEAILSYAAKYKARYQVKLYALAIEGNHIQAPAHFPQGRRADFMRDFNSSIYRAVERLTPNYPGGGLFARRYSAEFLGENRDIENYFFYTVLQAVQDGLVHKLSEYPFYNCFSDAVNGIERKFEVVNWAEYNARVRYNPKLKPRDFTEIVVLKYDRLPGYEELSQKEYSKLMHKKLEERRVQLVKKRLDEGKGFLGREALLRVVPGTLAKNPKRSTSKDHRPRVLSSSDETRAEMKKWYFDLYFAYKKASLLYRAGDMSVEFPVGMYPPHLPYRQSLHPD